MTAIALDGLATAAQIKRELSLEVEKLRGQGIAPGLGTLLVGDDPGSHSYVGGKHRDCAEVGIESIRIDLPASATEADVRAAIGHLNSASEVTGYIVQLPLPFGMGANQMLELIDPKKDADGLHPENLGKLVMNTTGKFDSPLPCTPNDPNCGPLSTSRIGKADILKADILKAADVGSLTHHPFRLCRFVQGLVCCEKLGNTVCRTSRPLQISS